MKKIINYYQKNKTIIFEIIAIILIALFSFSLAPKILQNDTFYTVTIGKLIQENGIDMKDHFSWHEDLPYTYPHWLYDVIMSYIYNFGGWKGVYISVCLLSIILGIIIYEVNRKLNKNQIISLVITLLSMYLLKNYITARAQLVTFIIYVIVIYLMEKFIHTQNKKIYYGIGIIFCSILIANLHVAVWTFLFVISLPYIAEYIIALLSDVIIYRKLKIIQVKWGIKHINNKEKVNKLKTELEDIYSSIERRKIYREQEEPYKIVIEHNKNIKWFIVIMLICVLTGFLTPLGTTPYTYLYNTMKGNTTSNINEHLPMTLSKDIPILCTIVVTISILTFTKTKIRISDLFMMGGLCYLMLSTKRQASMFVLIGSIILNRLISNAIEIYGYGKIEDFSKKLINIFTIALITTTTCYYSYKFIDKKKSNIYVSENIYPVKAADWILENLDLNNIKLFNEYNYGSYLLYRGIPVFIDSRADLYSPEFNQKGDDIFMNFINTSSIGKYYGTTFKDYNITHVIVYKNSKISMLIDNADQEKYNKIYSDEDFVIYEILK